MIERNPSCYEMIDHVARMLVVQGRRLRKLYTLWVFFLPLREALFVKRKIRNDRTLTVLNGQLNLNSHNLNNF